MPTFAALIVAAGRGERAGGETPKQYREVAGRPLLYWSAQAFAQHGDVNAVQFVIGADQADLFDKAVPAAIARKPVVGGATRQDSVRNGLDALSDVNPDFVLVHDAARPLVSRSLVDRVIGALRAGAEAAVPLLPVTDTLRRRESSGRWTLIARESLHRAQTPQGFRFHAIREAHHAHSNHQVTDDMALAELAGLRIEAVAGEESNLKVTTAEDFVMAERLLRSAGGDVRTGMGYDAHRFTKGDHVWLGGIRIAHDHALEGHSDADAALHALTDAILGALGAGDIGQHFAPSDERWRGAPSYKFLAHAAALVRHAGGEIVHGDVTIICESPKIGPHREAMRARIAEILDLDVSRISVKATTTEGMGFTGRKEGLAAQAVATIRL